ncbi:MAG TPA: phosphoribosylglycinamide formyltransferase [Candidatus Limnocylindria bacterium]|jgi:phosphoribosylglycinamide formyltransferase-1|nr:phosphoribosylglycinamide formyltransferase [Candidatus Limnocylindria bacterium]
MTFPLAVLVSGRGSNLQAILDACASGALDAHVALVVSNRAGVPALERASRAGVPSVVVAFRDYPDRAAAHAAMGDAIAKARARLVVLAGFDHILAPSFFLALPGVPVINLHPALLPFFGGRGMHGDKVHAAVLASGATESGCTVHRVHPETVDLGEVVVQRRVPVLPGDNAATLAARVLEQEHLAIVDAIRRFVPAATATR